MKLVNVSVCFIFFCCASSNGESPESGHREGEITTGTPRNAEHSEKSKRDGCFELSVIDCHSLDEDFFECRVKRKALVSSYGPERVSAGSVYLPNQGKALLYLESLIGDKWIPTGFYVGTSHNIVKTVSSTSQTGHPKWAQLPIGQETSIWVKGMFNHHYGGEVSLEAYSNEQQFGVETTRSIYVQKPEQSEARSTQVCAEAIVSSQPFEWQRKKIKADHLSVDASNLP